jgi:hypothetical protein
MPAQRHPQIPGKHEAFRLRTKALPVCLKKTVRSKKEPSIDEHRELVHNLRMFCFTYSSRIAYPHE